MDTTHDISALLEENRTLKNQIMTLQETQDHCIRTEKLASVGRLSAGIAHEINNPVGFVSSNSTTLTGYINRINEILAMYRKGIDRDIIAKREKTLKIDFIIEDIGNLLMENIEGLARITNIISNLKKFSRNDNGSEYMNADLNEAIRSVLVISKNETKYYADIKTDLGDIGMIYCNISELNQVILNLIINAVQALKELDRENLGQITIRTYKDSDWIYCEIADDGPGIPNQIKSKIFDPFYTTKEVGVGTGLGLSICHDIVVTKHKGRITLDSEVGKGTVFTIVLPRYKDGTNE